MTPRPAPCTVEVRAVAGGAATGDVWAILADPSTYATWVSGTALSRAATGAWPEVGASLRHHWGLWPIRFRDRTTVTACQEKQRLDLEVSVGPLATVAVTIKLVPEADGNGIATKIVLRETVVHGAALLAGSLTRRFQQWRNRRSLDALVRMSVPGRAP